MPRVHIQDTQNFVTLAFDVKFVHHFINDLIAEEAILCEDRTTEDERRLEIFINGEINFLTFLHLDIFLKQEREPWPRRRS